MAKNKLLAKYSSQISVDVVYANDAKNQVVIPVKLPCGSTIHDAIVHSGVLIRFPEIDLTTQRVGVFSKQRTLTTQLTAGDRVEIYRPLLIDPKLARHKRV